MAAKKFTILLMLGCLVFMLAQQSAFGAIKIVKFNVPSCE